MNLSSNSNRLEISNSGIQIWKVFFLVCFCFSSRLTRSHESTALTELLEKLKSYFIILNLQLGVLVSKVVY